MNSGTGEDVVTAAGQGQWWKAEFGLRMDRERERRERCSSDGDGVIRG
jgi:hypothetical protein